MKNRTPSYLLFTAFIISFVISFAFVLIRMIDYPERDIDHITINFYLVLSSLILTLFTGLLLVYSNQLKKDKIGSTLTDLLYLVIVVFGGGLAWSTRGIWGHQTGTVFFGGVISLILVIKFEKIDFVYFILFQIIAFSLGAMIPFACYPIIPRILAFGIWGSLGGFFAGFSFMFDGKGNSVLKSLSEEKKILLIKIIVKLTFIGFVALSMGTAFWAAISHNSNWIDGAFGGFVAGGGFGLIYYVGIKKIILYSFFQKKFEAILKVQKTTI